MDRKRKQTERDRTMRVGHKATRARETEKDNTRQAKYTTHESVCVCLFVVFHLLFAFVGTF